MLQVQGCYGLEPLCNVSGLIHHEALNSTVTKTKGAGGGGVSSSSTGKKSSEAAKKHALAEQQRRKRINTHINTLRKFFPDLPKRDKPRVLMETVRHLKELRRKVADHVALLEDGEGHCNLSNGAWPLFLPGEKDVVKVICFQGEGEGKMAKATICCEDRPRLNGDLTEAVRSVKGRVIKAEMATIGGRTKAELVVQWCKESGGARHEDFGSLRRALKAVVENRALGCSGLLSPNLVSSSWGVLGLELARDGGSSGDNWLSNPAGIVLNSV